MCSTADVSGKSRHGELRRVHRGSTVEFPSSCQLVLHRQASLFRQMKRRDSQLAAQEKACDVARGSWSVCGRGSRGLNAKLLAFDMQLDVHEVAVLELETQGGR